MTNIFIYVVAFFITLPFIATWMVYIMAKKITNHKLRAFHISVHWTTICYVIAVMTLSSIYFERLYGGIIGILFLLMLSGVVIYQWKAKTDIRFGKAIKFVWRFCFLLFGFLYIGFLLYGIGSHIIQ